MGYRTELPKDDKEEAFTFAPSTPAGTGPTPDPTPTPPPDPTPAPDWRELRRQERAERRAERQASHQGYNWVGGVILILLGGIFLLQNTGLIDGFDNWWALFILIPAIGSFAAAWNLYRSEGNQLTGAVLGSVVGGLVLTSIAGAFLFGWGIGNLWPVFLIIGGLSILLGARR